MHRRVALLVLIALTACTAAPATTEPKQPLHVKVLYPLADTNIQMGKSLKAIIEVQDQDGASVTDANVTLTILDPKGKEVASLPAAAGAGDVFRSEGWAVPHRSEAGAWSLSVRASRKDAEGAALAAFEVSNAISEDLLYKYGFWLDDPSLNAIQTSIGREMGDAQDGLVSWGGFGVAMHVLPESRAEVYWRTGKFPLESSDQVRDFLLDQVGNLGFIPLRELNEFHRVRFKQWDAWQDTARGRLSQYDIQYVVFYAPEVDKTYAISTMAVQPPVGIDHHAKLRDSFEVHPEVHAAGKADIPMPRLLPTPRLLSPALGTRFMGAGSPIVMTWQPVKELAADEYYKVKIDFDYSETNTSLYYATRDTQFTLPAALYSIPNCGVFNWQVTLMRGAGVGKDGQPLGEALSYDSLHWYVEWLYPLTEKMPFTPHCQNPQT